jgi:beta-galactosidase
VDFGAVMTAATVWINGEKLGEYRGGYTPFSFEMTQHLNWRGDNVLAVEVDSTERADIPPFGGEIDYLTFGGIYRDVALRVVPNTFIENVFAKPVDVLTGESQRFGASVSRRIREKRRSLQAHRRTTRRSSRHRQSKQGTY